MSTLGVMLLGAISYGLLLPDQTIKQPTVEGRGNTAKHAKLYE